MANANAPYGFRVLRKRDGTLASGNVHNYTAPADYATALYIGQAVKFNNTTSADNFGIVRAEVVPAGATDVPLGIIMGFEPNPSSLTTRHGPASTLRTVMVMDNTDVELVAQEDSVGGALDETASGKTIRLIAGTPSTVTGRSNDLLDSSTVHATDEPFRILYPLPVGSAASSRNAIGNYCQWVVKIKTGTA